MQTYEATDKVRRRAHQLWEEAGHPHGRDLEHWLKAEAELREGSTDASPVAETEMTSNISAAGPDEKPAKKAKAPANGAKAPGKPASRSKTK